jgi:hypothetical protein
MPIGRYDPQQGSSRENANPDGNDGFTELGHFVLLCYAIWRWSVVLLAVILCA